MSPTTRLVIDAIVGVLVAALVLVAIVLAVKLYRLRRDLDRRAPLLDPPRSHRAAPKERRFLVAGDGRRSPQRVELRRMHQPAAVMPRVVPGEETVEIKPGGVR